jgi:thymidylate synthase
MDPQAKLIESDVISSAWLDVLRRLLNSNGHCYNLIVQIKHPLQRNYTFEKELDDLCRRNNLLTTKHVAYTIFPRSLWKIYCGDHEKFFEKYITRVYPRIRTSWGNYFHRMIHWTADHGAPPTNQLSEIIEAIKKSSRIWKAAYTIQITSPMMHFRRVRGAPCLNYIALQLQENRVINLMAVFRNHYLFPRIYGNYIGLGQLLEFICDRTGFEVGVLTCLSSHAGLSESSRPTKFEMRNFLSRYVSGVV